MANELDFGTAIALIKGVAGKPDPADITAAVDDWLDDHPEATTTVQDGSITKAKLDSSLKNVAENCVSVAVSGSTLAFSNIS